MIRRMLRLAIDAAKVEIDGMLLDVLGDLSQELVSRGVDAEEAWR